MSGMSSVDDANLGLPAIPATPPREGRPHRALEAPDSPPQLMDMSNEYSPDKDQLREEMSILQQQLTAVTAENAQATTALAAQDSAFRRVAKQYETEARDINQVELA